jgi:hypothetical protein
MGRSSEAGDEEEGVDGRLAESRCAEIQRAISVGATSFLLTEYRYLAVFTASFAAVIFLSLGSVRRFSLRPEPCARDPARECRPAVANAAFLLGAATSVASGYLGMRVATFANARTTALEERRGVGPAFAVPFRAGAAMGFLLASSALLVLYAAVNLFGLYYGDDWAVLYEAVNCFLNPLPRYSPRWARSPGLALVEERNSGCGHGRTCGSATLPWPSCSPPVALAVWISELVVAIMLATFWHWHSRATWSGGPTGYRRCLRVRLCTCPTSWARGTRPLLEGQEGCPSSEACSPKLWVVCSCWRHGVPEQGLLP